MESLTSETTEVWANADGTMSAEVHAGQVRVRDGRGGWAKVDLNLRRRPDGSVAPGVHPEGLVLSGAVGAGEHDLAVLGSGDERVAVGWRGVLPDPVLDGTRATYVDVKPGIDLVIETRRSGFETFLVVKNRAAAGRLASVAMPWRTGMLTTQPGGGGGFDLRDRVGEVRGRVSAAFMWDARVDSASGLPARRVPVALGTQSAGAGRTDLVLTPDAAFLADPTTVYPVTIDPQWNIGTTGDTYVESDIPNTSKWSSTELLLGTYNDGGVVARSFLRFDLAPFYGTVVNSATLRLWETWAWSCFDAEWRAYVAGYVDHTTTWNTQPSMTTHVGTSSQTTGRDECEPDGWVAIDARGFFQAAADAQYPYYSLGLRATQEGNNGSTRDSWKRFHSANGVNDPYVTINFNYRPTVAGLATVPTTSGCVTGPGRPWMTSRTPRLSATVSDADGQSSSATFEWWVTGGSLVGSATVPGVPSGSVASADVPPGAFTEGATYSWRVSATDTGGASSGWSPWCEFTVDSTAPGVPFVSSAQYPENGRGTASSGQFTFTPATGNTDVVAFTYQMDTDTAATTVAGTGPTSVTITPSAEGHRTLTVRAKDRAGNVSAPKLYAFEVGRAGIAQPLPGATMVTRTKIAIDVADTTLTRATFQYRRGPGGNEHEIPLANLRKADGSPITSYPVSLSSLGGHAIWNAADTLGSAGGVVQVRAALWPTADGQPSYSTAWVTATVDPNGDGAAATNVGPGSVNLLTGDHTLSSTDVDELGLTVGRVASSREPADGWLPQGQRLTDNQQQVGTDVAGFGTGGTSSLARSTTRGQASSADSLEITPVLSNGDTFANLGCDLSLCSGMQPGRRYRMTGWIYVPAATGLTGEYANRGLRIVGFYRDGSGYHEVASALAAWVDGWQELSVELVVPAGASEAFFRLYNGMPGGSGKKVYFDNLSLREVVAPFGPSWRGGVADAAAGSEFVSLDFPDPDVARVVTATGDAVSFAKSSGGQFFPQPGAESLTLTYTAGTDTYDLTDVDGTVVRFTKPAAAGKYMVASTWIAASASTTTTSYVYDTTDNRTLISRVVNPAEPGVTGCLVAAPAVPGRGCEVLEYVYATASTATPTVFGDIKDQVRAVRLWSWDPTAGGGDGAMAAVDAVRYTYDDAGRLREAWDPRVASPLKTIYEYDTAGRVTSVTSPGELPWMFDYGTIAADPGNAGRIHRVRRAALQQGSPTATDGEIATRIVYTVPLTRGAGGPHDMDHAAVSTWGQQDLPTDATAIFGPQDDPLIVQATASTPGADGYTYANVHYLNASAQEINTATPQPAGLPGATIDSVGYDRFGNTAWTLQATNRLLALGQLPNATTMLTELGLSGLDFAARAQALATINKYSADGIDLLETTGPTLKLILGSALADPDGAGPLPALAAGSTVAGRPRTVNAYDEGKPDGATYHLITTSTQGAAVAGYPDADARVTKTGYSAEKGGTSGWQLKKATSTTVDAAPGGINVSSYAVHDSAGRTTVTWGIGADGSDPRTTVSIYYTAGDNSADAACGNRPEWAGQPCVTKVAGPVTGQRPDMSADLPITRIESYNRHGAPSSTVDTATGSLRRTTKTFDPAGRVLTAEVTSDEGVALPEVVTTYSETSGRVATTTMGDAVIAREYDLLGRLVTYSDADGGITRYEYDRYGRAVLVSDNTGSSTLAYDQDLEPRGLLTSLTDSVAGTFTMKYSPDERLVELTYPGGLTRRDTLDANLEPVGRTYTRDRDGMVIYAESAVENSHGQRVEHAYTGGSRTYGYDRSGRLTKVEQTSTDAGGCVTRTYEYDNRTNRTRKSVFNPDIDGSCRTGVPDATEQHAYDSADRITNAGFDYDPFGRTVGTPDGLFNTYYSNDLVATQLLGTTRRTWTHYPDQRSRRATTEVLSGGAWSAAATTLNHYGDDTDRPRWTSEDGGSISRYLSGPDDELLASTSATGDVRLRLTNLHGDVVVTVDTGLTSAEVLDFDEYGLPASGQAPHRYGWLGGKQRSAEALGGSILMGVRLYSPALGRFLQVDPVPGASATAYDYCFADAVNCVDLDGRWPSWATPKGAWNGVKKAASWTYAHSSDIGTVVGCVSMFLPPPFNVIGGGIALGFSAVGAYRDYRSGNWGQLGLTALGAIPGVGALAKGARYYQTGRQLATRAARLREYVPKYGSRAKKLKDLVRPWRKARTANNKANAGLAPWERWATRVTYLDSGRMVCKYWSSCQSRAPYGRYYL